MKMFPKVVASAFGVATALALTSSAQANLLVDPGFEAGAPGQANPIPLPAGANGGWAVFNGAAYSTAAAESGSYSLVETEAAGSQWNFEAAYQVVSGITPGLSYTLTGDYMATTPLSSYNPIFIQMTFFDATGTDLGTVQTSPGHALAVQYGAPAQNTWYTATVTATAPAGAVYAAPYLAMMENGGSTAPETIYWDNANLIAVPEPATVALLGMGLALPLYIIRRRK